MCLGVKLGTGLSSGFCYLCLGFRLGTGLSPEFKDICLGFRLGTGLSPGFKDICLGFRLGTECVLESSGSGLVFRVQDSGFMYMGSELKVRCHV